MCIALLSTAHPGYRLILIDNRDEYINRPTAKAEWWGGIDDDDVLGGRDLLREVQGTWLGVTRKGKLAVLTNFREDVTPPPTAVSRGEIIKKFLTEKWSTEDFVRDAVNTGVAKNAGGFSLVCGYAGEQLAVISNRARDGSEVPWICGDVVQTVGLSNTHFGDGAWPKVVDGEVGLLRVIRENIKSEANEENLIEGLLELLSDDALTRMGVKAEDGLETHVLQLRNTILVPPLGRKDLSGMPADEVAGARKHETARLLRTTEELQHTKQLGVSGIYATQKQTVVLFSHDGQVRFVEKTLFDDDCEPVPGKQGVVDITFHIQGQTS